jgi:hypothetical protein
MLIQKQVRIGRDSRLDQGRQAQAHLQVSSPLASDIGLTRSTKDGAHVEAASLH